jgi:hypothetical protein
VWVADPFFHLELNGRIRTAVMTQIPADTPARATQFASTCDDTRAQVGYAYLQTLALQASFSCSLVAHHADGAGVDVRFDIHERLDVQAHEDDFSLEFQLRATARGLPIVHSKLLFSLETDRYEMLRSAALGRPRFVVLLSLPPADPDECDTVSSDDLVTQLRGRWLCLCGAPQAANTATTVVRFPTWNVLTPAALREIARRVSLDSRFYHEQ